jgi:hypothetical protein
LIYHDAMTCKEAAMATREEIFPSKFLKCEDLKGKPRVVQIEDAPVETLKNNKGEEQSKIVLYFAGAKKALPLNMTNFDAVVDVTGCGDSRDWRGHRIELYPSKTQMGGKLVDCIRVRPPREQQPPQMRPKQPEPPPHSEVPPRDEMDDFISI